MPSRTPQACRYHSCPLQSEGFTFFSTCLPTSSEKRLDPALIRNDVAPAHPEKNISDKIMYKRITRLLQPI
jgi:hypothetical protein